MSASKQMPLNKVKRDEHGLYVKKRNGCVYRPVVSKFTAGIPAAFDRSTIFQEGDDVRIFAERASDVPSLCTVWSLTAPYAERWSFHGAVNDSEGIWNPAIRRTVLMG